MTMHFTSCRFNINLLFVIRSGMGSSNSGSSSSILFFCFGCMAMCVSVWHYFSTIIRTMYPLCAHNSPHTTHSANAWWRTTIALRDESLCSPPPLLCSFVLQCSASAACSHSIREAEICWLRWWMPFHKLFGFCFLAKQLLHFINWADFIADNHTQNANIRWLYGARTVSVCSLLTNRLNVQQAERIWSGILLLLSLKPLFSLIMTTSIAMAQHSVSLNRSIYFIFHDSAINGELTALNWSPK